MIQRALHVLDLATEDLFSIPALGCRCCVLEELGRAARSVAVGETVILMTPPCLPLLKRPLKVEGGAAG